MGSMACAQAVLSNMLHPCVKQALVKEIRGIRWILFRQERLLRKCRAEIQENPEDPDEDQEILQGYVSEVRKWTRARNARVLQLMGNRVKGPILSTSEGQRNVFLSSPSITIKCKKSTH